MAPSLRRRANPTKPKTTTTKKPTRTQCKKQQQIKNVRLASPPPPPPPPSMSPEKLKINEFNFDCDLSTTSTNTCSTPKAQRFQIPKIENCPPAPMKQRVIPNCSLRRRSIAFLLLQIWNSSSSLLLVTSLSESSFVINEERTGSGVECQNVGVGVSAEKAAYYRESNEEDSCGFACDHCHLSSLQESQ